MAMVERNKIEWRKTQVVQSNGQLVQIHGKSKDKQIDQRGIGRESTIHTKVQTECTEKVKKRKQIKIWQINIAKLVMTVRKQQ